MNDISKPIAWSRRYNNRICKDVIETASVYEDRNVWRNNISPFPNGDGVMVDI